MNNLFLFLFFQIKIKIIIFKIFVLKKYFYNIILMEQTNEPIIKKERKTN